MNPAALDPQVLPTTERRARYWTDTARMWHALGEDRRTVAALRTMEAVAPGEVRRPSVRSLTQAVLYGPAGGDSKVRAFAQRTGAQG